MNAEITDALRWHLDPFRRPRADPGALDVMFYVPEEDAGSSPPLLSYFRGSELMFAHENPQRLFRYAVWDIQYAASQFVRSFVALHAGAVTTSAGALLLPGPQEAGKSTLVAALLARGFDYLSDEVGALDPVTGKAYPYPKSLHLAPDAVSLFPGLEERLEDGNGRARSSIDRTVRPQDLRARVGGPAHVRWLVVLTRDREGPARLVPMSSSEAVEKMAESAFNLHRYAARGVVLLSRMAADAETFRLKGGTALQRADLLADRFPRAD